jgi:uncharacterized membrane protein YbhN (UPF0104 family)
VAGSRGVMVSVLTRTSNLPAEKVGIMQFMRKFAIAFALFLGFIFVIAKLTELQEIGETLRKGIWWYLGLALMIEVLWVINCGASFKFIYRAMGIDEKLGALSLMVLAANFLNAVAPSVGVSGVAIFMSEARRRNNCSRSSCYSSFHYI